MANLYEGVPWSLLETAKRRKNHPKPENRKPHAKLSKPATRRLTKDPCDISIGLLVSGNSRSVEARNCRSDRRETGTQIGQIGKTENRIGYQIRQPFSIFCENRKPNVKKRKIRKP